MKKEIFKYRMLTIAFSIFAFGSLGTFDGFSSLFRIALTFISFSSVALYFFVKEEELVRQYKKNRRAIAKRKRLTVYTGTKRKKVSVA